MAITKTSQSSKQNLTQLRTEVSQIRSFLIGLAGKDTEGEYRPEFVDRVLQQTTDAPTEEFTTAEDFLQRLR
ncbi:hypothetical protein HY523_02565 [Candidatus Berkelbacteria bacterium]|nr:hypothetical protein [Candidatus Berkelbacteria bacterium]